MPSRKTSVHPPRTARSRARAPEGNRRQALLDAAAKLFSTQGFVSTSVRDITAAVGMLPGSMYYHFKSKEELVLAARTSAGVTGPSACHSTSSTSASRAPIGRRSAMTSTSHASSVGRASPSIHDSVS